MGTSNLPIPGRRPDAAGRRHWRAPRRQSWIRAWAHYGSATAEYMQLPDLFRQHDVVDVVEVSRYTRTQLQHRGGEPGSCANPHALQGNGPGRASMDARISGPPSQAGRGDGGEGVPMSRRRNVRLCLLFCVHEGTCDVLMHSIAHAGGCRGRARSARGSPNGGASPSPCSALTTGSSRSDKASLDEISLHTEMRHRVFTLQTIRGAVCTAFCGLA